MGNYTNPDPQSNLYLFQDLSNRRLTWRLYDQKGSKPTLLLVGFYQSNGAFAINHEYSNGLGDTLGTAIRSRMRDAMRSLARRSRDVYNYRNEIDSIKNSVSNALLGNLGNLAQRFGADENNLLTEANRIIQDFDIGKEWERMLNFSKTVTQGTESKLFEKTSISIPSISSLSTTIWSTPDISCREVVENLSREYFLGKFHKLANEGGGYWEAPNNLNLGSDDPLSDSNLTGSFMLRAGPYLFKNLLIVKFGWQFSKEFIAFPTSDGGVPKVKNEPAYAEVSIDLDNYKYKTDKYLSTTYIPDQSPGEISSGHDSIDNYSKHI